MAAPRKDRFESLDVLRGVAVLGIFAVNVLAMGFPWTVLSNPTVFAQFHEAGGRFWHTVSATFFQFKFITLFSAMFGAGMVLMLGGERDETSASAETALHRRRMGWLFVIGMIHCHLIWYGDILVPYAIAGLIVVGARFWPVRRLIGVGALLITANFALFAMEDIGVRMMDPAERAELQAEIWSPPPQAIEEDLDLYRGNFIERLPGAAGQSLLAQSAQTFFLGARTVGLMMLGMAAYKSGFLTLGWPGRRYLALGGPAALAGAAGSLWGARHNLLVDFDMARVFAGEAALYWASLLQAFGYAALVMAACTAPVLAKWRAPFAAAGRMALTNYLASSIIGVLIFYGPPGLGLIGTFSFPELALTVAAVWTFILAWSPLWLARFRFGPAEWLWRSLTYGEMQPMGRGAGAMNARPQRGP